VVLVSRVLEPELTVNIDFGPGRKRGTLGPNQNIRKVQLDFPFDMHGQTLLTSTGARSCEDIVWPEVADPGPGVARAEP